MWETLLDRLKWLLVAIRLFPAASVKTKRFEIRGATAAEVIKIMRELPDARR